MHQLGWVKLQCKTWVRFQCNSTVTPNAEDPLRRGDDGLFRARSGDPLPNDDTASLQVGALEGSNVNPIEAMVGMIQTARQFETQMRLLQTAESNDRSAGQLLGLQG